MTRKRVYDDGMGGQCFPLGEGEDSRVRAHVYAWERTPDDRSAEVWVRLETFGGLDTTFFGSAEGMRRLGEHLIAAADAVEGKAGSPVVAELLRQRDEDRAELVKRSMEINALRGEVERFERGLVATLRHGCAGPDDDEGEGEDD